MKKRVFVFVVSLLALHPWSGELSAQSLAGRIVGSVRDETGAVVADASVTLEQPETGLVRRTTSSSTGDYTFSFVPPGKYTLQAEGAGFQSAKRPATVAVQATVRVDFDLSVASRTEDVT